MKDLGSGWRGKSGECVGSVWVVREERRGERGENPPYKYKDTCCPRVFPASLASSLCLLVTVLPAGGYTSPTTFVENKVACRRRHGGRAWVGHVFSCPL